jgi:hypothetical protein
MGFELGPDGCAASFAVVNGAPGQAKLVPRVEPAFFAIIRAWNDLTFFYKEAFAALVVV